MVLHIELQANPVTFIAQTGEVQLIHNQRLYWDK